jgi:cell surface protein SprA
MPYDPANFSFSYSHSSKHSDGQTLVYDNEDTWRGAINYSWVPVYKPLEPFKKWKTKSKYAEILKKWAFNYLPQNISANTEMTRSYTETLERDLENLENVNDSLVTYSSQFLWNRDLSIRWDLTKNLHLSFQSATRAEIEEPKNIRQINKDLAPDDYAVWKDSVWQSIKHMGSPLDYNQNFNASYKLPLNMMPIFDWLNADGTYSATYHWARGSADEYGEIKYGHTITSNRTININSSMAMEKLYNHIPFLKKVNDKFNKSGNNSNTSKKTKTTKKKSKTELAAEGEELSPEDAKKKIAGPTDEEKKEKLLAQQKKNTFSKLITIPADTTITLTHGKKTKRIIVSAKDEDGKTIPIKFKKVDENKIMVFNKADSAVKMKVSVLALEPLDDKGWYKALQYVSRFAMMVRNVSASYKNQYSLTLPGFMNNVGDVFGQKNVADAMSPGLDFAFGFIGDDYIEKARSRGWLLNSQSEYASPATISKTEDLQIKFTLEPFKNFKIDMNMAHTHTRSKSIQYMYDGNPTTHSGSFSMTTISISSALAGIGDANNGFHSSAFEKFCGSLEGYRQRVQAQYENTVYPEGTTYAGTKFNAEKTPVELYSADVMVPAFLNAYTGYKSLKLFPTIARMLPNWSMKYSGLSNLPWIRDHFKSVNINHGYKSIYAVGAYSSYSTYKSFMGDNIGFINSTTTGNPVPNSMFNISTVSINEAFSPLLGLDFTLPNNLTFKAEYRTTRVMTLSMTSVQLNETLSKDWVFGVGYKIADFRFIRSKAKALAAKNSRNNRGDGDDDNNSRSNTKKSSTQNNKSKGFAHDLNLRLDVSWRKQAAITRDIATVSSQATSGNNAFKLAFTADYSLSRLLTMSFYYDRQSNTPLLSSSSYPTVTQDFGLSMKFSLTR